MKCRAWCPHIGRVLITFMLFNLDLISAQDYGALTRCAESVAECEVKAIIENCGDGLQCLNNLKSTCDIIGYAEVLSLRRTWYEYRCTDQGQADYDAYLSCLIKQSGGLPQCLHAWADDDSESCVSYQTYQSCVMSNCGEAVARYVYNELGVLLTCGPNSGINGGTPGEDSALYQQCSVDQTECEARTNCGETLECLINVKKICNIFAFTEALSLRIKWYEYKCSEKGQADEVEFHKCFSSGTGEVSDCRTSYAQELPMLAGKPQKICSLQERYEECVMTNCGEAAERYLRRELGDVIRFACSGLNGGVDLLRPKFWLIWLSLLIYMVNSIY